MAALWGSDDVGCVGSSFEEDREETNFSANSAALAMAGRYDVGEQGKGD